MAKIIPFPTARKQAAEPAGTACVGNTVLRFPGVADSHPTPSIPPASAMPAVPVPAPAAPGAPLESDAKKEAQRKGMITKIHVALNKLYKKLDGFTEDVYRYTLGARWGVNSSTEMNIAQLDEVLRWLAELGFQGNHAYYGKRDYYRWGTAALIRKIDALLAEKGKKETGTYVGFEYAEGILRQMTKGEVTDIYKANPKQLRAVIAALSKDATRKGRRVR